MNRKRAIPILSETVGSLASALVLIATARKQKVSNGPRLRVDAWKRDGFLSTATSSAAP